MRLFVSAAIALWICANATPTYAQSLSVEWANERLTIAAKDVPLAEVLTEVAQRTGSRVVGLETAPGLVTIDVREGTLFDAFRTLLADVHYMLIQPYSVSTASYDRFTLWVYGPSNMAATERPCVTTPAGKGPGRPTGCDEVGQDVQAFDETPALATDRFPAGPSPAEAEVARLVKEGFFNPDAKESSLAGLAKATDPNVRIRALQTLALQNKPGGVQVLKEALDDPNPFVRAEAVEMLLSVGPGAESARRLGDVLGHKDPAVRLPAVLALGEQSGNEAEFQLKRALDDDDEAVRGAAALMLQQKEEQKENGKRKP